jgi:hypothetical protein
MVLHDKIRKNMLKRAEMVRAVLEYRLQAAGVARIKNQQPCEQPNNFATAGRLKPVLQRA